MEMSRTAKQYAREMSASALVVAQGGYLEVRHAIVDTGVIGSTIKPTGKL